MLKPVLKTLGNSVPLSKNEKYQQLNRKERASD
jgi:hypothetical protein